MKLAGERAVIDSGAAYSVLRIPMLYGPSLELAESPVTETLLKLIPSADSVFPVHVDDWAMRYPAHVDDVARAVSFIWDRRKGGIFHFAGVEAMTKYRMTLRMASLAGLDSRAILPDPLPSGTVPRPKDCRLDGSSLEALGFTPRIRFETGIRELLAGFFPLLSERELPAGA
jgi:dTDP-4-dehydrorhamnose reductase